MNDIDRLENEINNLKEKMETVQIMMISTLNHILNNVYVYKGEVCRLRIVPLFTANQFEMHIYDLSGKFHTSYMLNFSIYDRCSLDEKLSQLGILLLPAELYHLYGEK